MTTHQEDYSAQALHGHLRQDRRLVGLCRRVVSGADLLAWLGGSRCGGQATLPRRRLREGKVLALPSCIGGERSRRHRPGRGWDPALRTAFPHVRWEAGSMLDASFCRSLGTFDHVFLLEVLQYVPPQQCLATLWGQAGAGRPTHWRCAQWRESLRSPNDERALRGELRPQQLRRPGGNRSERCQRRSSGRFAG